MYLGLILKKLRKENPNVIIETYYTYLWERLNDMTFFKILTVAFRVSGGQVSNYEILTQKISLKTMLYYLPIYLDNV